MSPLSQFMMGFAATFSAFAKVGWRVYAIVFALCAALFIGGLCFGTSLFTFAKDFLATAEFMPESLTDAASWIGGALSFVAALFVVGVIGGSLILLILSPVLSHVADKAWVEAGHAEPNDSFMDILHSIVRGILVALRCFVLQVVCLVAIFIFSFVPVVGVAAPVLSLLAAAFFYGQSMIDYAVERAEIDGAIESGSGWRFPFNNIALTMGLGFLYALVMLIPFLGSYVALYVAPATVAAGGAIVGRAAGETRGK